MVTSTMLWHVSSLLILGPNDKLLSLTPAQSLPAPFPFCGDTSISVVVIHWKRKEKDYKGPKWCFVVWDLSCAMWSIGHHQNKVLVSSTKKKKNPEAQTTLYCLGLFHGHCLCFFFCYQGLETQMRLKSPHCLLSSSPSPLSLSLPVVIVVHSPLVPPLSLKRVAVVEK